MKGITLSECLAGLTKQNLTQIRTHLGIQGVSSLKKQELIDVLVQQVPEKLPDLLRSMDTVQYNTIKQVAAQGGQAEMQLAAEELEYFSQRALLFAGRENGQAIIMPKEVLESFQGIADIQPPSVQSKGNSEQPQYTADWIKLIQGLLYYYGVQTFEDLIRGLEQHAGSKPDVKQLKDALNQAIADGARIGVDTQKAWSTQVENPAAVLQEQQLKSNFDFYPFTKEELLAAGEPGFVDRTPVYRNFVNLIKANYTITAEEADALVSACVIASRNGKSSSDLFKMLQSQLHLDEVELIKAVMEQSILLHNNTRQWVLKGYSPNQLSDQQNRRLRHAVDKANVASMASSKKKVGRNDPCPCGSGKKYKKCCGQ